MNKDKIAVLVDSGTDVPKELVEKYGVYVVPLSIKFSDKTYADDGIDITPEEIYARLDSEIPQTSLPAGEVILSTFQKIKSEGYEKLLVVTISSGLSGTYNFIRILGEDFAGLEVFVVDTKNIGIASGMTAIFAAQNIEKGLSWAELKEATVKSVAKSKVFFCVSTLKYLRKGGRIGLVSSIIGENLHIKPVISCNEEGIYYMAAKTVGRKKSIQKVLELVEKFKSAHSAQTFNIAIAQGNALDEALELKEQVIAKFKNCATIFEGQISPTLVVHTGPGLLGVGIQVLT